MMLQALTCKACTGLDAASYKRPPVQDPGQLSTHLQRLLLHLLQPLLQLRVCELLLLHLVLARLQLAARVAHSSLRHAQGPAAT